MSDKNRITATARVQVTVEVSVSDTWGDDCTVRQVHDQAARAAVAKIEQRMRGEIRVVGTPNVMMVTTGAATITPPPTGAGGKDLAL